MRGTTLVAACAALLTASAAASAGPTNLAPQAQVSASSEFSDAYKAAFAVDGVICGVRSGDDPGKAWAVHGPTAGGSGWFALEWPAPVRVAEVVYYGRTSFGVEECFRDFELLADGVLVASGAFERGHGPQPVRFEPREVSRLELLFHSSYGGPNPGAAEIQVYDEHTPEGFLPRFLLDGWGPPEVDDDLQRRVDAGELGFDSLVLIERQETNPSHVYTACCEGFGPGGGIYTLTPPTPEGELIKLVDSPEGQILDCDISYDGSRVLFSWRRTAADGYHIFTVNTDGSELTQLTDGAWHDYNACWLPDGGIAFLSTRTLRVGLCFVTPSGILHRMDADGGNVRCISSNYINDFTPSVLEDGRILYARWEYVDKPAIPIQSLWTMNPDGTGLSVFYGNRVLSPASLLEAKAVPGTTRVLATLTAHNGPIRGALGIIDRDLGVNAQEALTNLTPDIDIGRVDRGDGNHVTGPWESPYPVDQERFLASGKGTIYVGDYQGRWAIVRSRGEHLGFYNPVPIRPRSVPPVINSARGAQAAVAEPEAATVFLLDVYQGLEPFVRRGEVKELCVVQEVAKPLRVEALGFGFQRPVISCGATYAVKKVWGTVPVEEDGSAHFAVPSDVPLYFEALDEDGRAVQRMRSFTHFAPGEGQGCVGCHESRTATPPVHDAIALRREPSELAPPEWGVRGFSYPDIVQPVLDANCVSCHSGPRPSGAIDLSGDKTDWFSVSYDELTRGYVSWIDTRNGMEANILQIDPLQWGSPASRLTDIVLSGHPDETGKPRHTMSRSEQRRILAWIDLNVPYYGTYDMADPNAEGGRRVYPSELNQVLADVSARRCGVCHEGGPPTTGYVRLTNPELNDFLVAPLPEEQGGSGACGQAVFADADDADYRALLRTFDEVHALLVARPRIDMPGGQPAQVNTSCL